MNTEIRAISSLASLYAIRMLGLFMVLPVLFLYADHYANADARSLGLALGIYGLTQALFQLPLGLLSDFIGRKVVIVFGLLVFVAGSVVAASATSVEGLILGRALQGAGAIASTVMALLSDLTSEASRSKAMAIVGASIGVSFGLALILGPALTAFSGLQGVFVCAAALGLVGILVVLFWVPTPQNTAPGHGEQRAIPGMILGLVRHRGLARLNLGIFVLHATITGLFVVLPGKLVQDLNLLEPTHWKVYLPVLVLAFVVALPSMMAAERRGQAKLAFLVAIAVLALSLFGLARVAFGAGLVLLVFFFFVAFNLLEAMLPSLVSKVAPAGTRGTAMGLYSTCQFLGAFCGGVVGGSLVADYGSGLMLSLFALACVLWLLVALSMPRPRRLGRLTFHVLPSITELDIVNQPGVEECVYVADKGLLYINVNYEQLDLPALHQYIGAHVAVRP